MGLHCRREKAPELPEHDGQRQREAGHETDLHRSEERLGDTERHRLAPVGGQRSVQPVQEVPMEDERDRKADHERAE